MCTLLGIWRLGIQRSTELSRDIEKTFGGIVYTNGNTTDIIDLRLALRYMYSPMATVPMNSHAQSHHQTHLNAWLPWETNPPSPTETPPEASDASNHDSFASL